MGISCFPMQKIVELKKKDIDIALKKKKKNKMYNEDIEKFFRNEACELTNNLTASISDKIRSRAISEIDKNFLSNRVNMRTFK